MEHKKNNKEDFNSVPGQEDALKLKHLPSKRAAMGHRDISRPIKRESRATWSYRSNPSAGFLRLSDCDSSSSEEDDENTDLYLDEIYLYVPFFEREKSQNI